METRGGLAGAWVAWSGFSVTGALVGLNSFNFFNFLICFPEYFPLEGWNSKDFLYVALGSGGEFRGFWTSGGLGRRILEDFLALGASWPRPELARVGGS